jgi:hypothetical protein
MQKTLFTAAESSTLVLAALAVAQDGDTEKYLGKVERIVLDKLYDVAETDRLCKLRPAEV